MRPPEHTADDYARDLAALSRVLRRVVSDTKIGTKEKEDIERHLRAALSRLTTMKRRSS